MELGEGQESGKSMDIEAGIEDEANDAVNAI
jgi:hypothetical protein